MAISKSTREDYYEFLDLSGVDDNEKDELKSTLYDKNRNSNNTKGTEHPNCIDRSNINNKNKFVTSSDSYRSRGTFGGCQDNSNRIQQQGSNRGSYATSGSYQNSGNYYPRPKPTTWINNRKFHPQTNANQSSISKNNTTVPSKKHSYQQVNNNSRVSDNFVSEHSQQQSTICTSKNRPVNIKKGYDVNVESSSNSNDNQSAKISLNSNLTRINSSYSTDSVEYSCDDPSYAANTALAATVPSIEEVVMPRILTPLATLPLYAVVKPTLAATALLQPQTTIITKQVSPVTSTTQTPGINSNNSTTTASIPPSKQVPETVSSECIEASIENEDLENPSTIITPTQHQYHQLNNYNLSAVLDTQPSMMNNQSTPNSQNHSGLMSQQQQQSSQQAPPSQHQQAPVYMHPTSGPYAMYQPMPMIPPPGNVFVSNVTANVSVHGLMQPVQHFVPYVPAQDVAQTSGTGHDAQAQQQTPVIVNNQMRCQNRRGRGRTNSSSSNSQRRDYTSRTSNQQDMTATVMDSQPQMLTAPPGHYQYYVPYSGQHTGAPVYLHPGTQATAAPIYLHQMPMHGGFPMYGYPQMYPVPHEYIVDEKGVLSESVSESAPQMWSPNHEFQDTQHIPVQDDYISQQVNTQPDESLLAEDVQQNAHGTIAMHHQPLHIHGSSIPHSVLNPNVPNFTIVNQPLAVQNDQVAVPPHFNNNQTQQHDFSLPPQGNVSPVASNVISQSFANVSQHLAIATSTENKEETFMQSASAVTVVNTSSTYATVESISGIATVQQIENAVVAVATTSDKHADEYMATDNVETNNNDNVVNSDQVPSAISLQQQSTPLSQRVQQTSILQEIPLAKKTSSSSLVAQDIASVNNVPNQVSVCSSDSPITNANMHVHMHNPSTINSHPSSKVIDSNVNRVAKPVTEKPAVKSDRFGGASNAKPVAWNSSKKSTASVSVSAVPTKESQTNKMATVSPTVSSQETVDQSSDASKLSSAPSNVSSVKGYTSPVPKPQFKPVNKDGVKRASVSAAPQQVETKKVEQQNKEITANVTEKQLTLSLAPPPRPSNSNSEETKQAPAKSWASLFTGSTTASKPNPLPSSATSGDTSNRPVAKVMPFDGTSTSTGLSQGLYSSLQTASQTMSLKKTTIEKKPVADEYSLKLSNFLQNYKIDNNSISIFPRGLINRSNYCYINGILQALVSCPPFYHLMRDMPKQPHSVKAKGCTPILDAMQELMTEFQPKKVMREKGTSVKDIELVTDSPFEPTIIYKMLSNIRSEIFHVEGRQEDAEEFLGCILNKLNDEMLEIIKLTDKPPVAVRQNQASSETPNKKEELPNGEHNGEMNADIDGDDWQVIGSRNKGTITRTTDYARTPISDIFRGKLRSRVTREGDHSTDNIQPFFTLQLDIERANSVREALDLLVGRDPLEGVTSSKTNQEVTAWQQVTIEELPVVLILHLKCFDYKQDGCTKILKALEFPVELKIDTKLMSNKTKYTMKQRTYKLFAVVYHDGKEASKGHYLTDAFHIGYSSWIRYDDSSVKLVNDNQVLKPIPPRVPYLLCYRRFDTISTAQTNNNNNSNNNSNLQQQQQRSNYHHK